jgi:hypothetical protein
MNAAALVIGMVLSAAHSAVSSDGRERQTAAAPTNGVPRIVLLKTEHDAGTVRDDTLVRIEFPFRNDGTGTLVLDQRLSCSGTIHPLHLEIPPGGEGRVPISFDPHGKRGDQRQTITVTTNDSSSPEVRWRFRCFVQPVIEVEPPFAVFSNGPAGQVATALVTVRGPKELAVRYVSTTKGRFISSRVLEVREVVRSGEPATESLLEFTLRADAPPAPMHALAIARTTDPKHPLVEVLVSQQERAPRDPR